MTTYNKKKNRIFKLRTEIREIENTLKKAISEKKPHFAKRLNLMLEHKKREIETLNNIDI